MNFIDPEAIGRIIAQEVEKAKQAKDEEYKKIIEKDYPYILKNEKLRYMELLLNAQRSGCDCRVQVEEVVRDLHISFGYSK